jgi:UDPglucose--hexose-1-phosphate uridylyltransferase
VPEIRQSIATREWVIIATERARRPHEFCNEASELTEQRPARKADCPFCPGNEEAATMEMLRWPAEGPWSLRALLNKYPALDKEGKRVRCFDGIHRCMTGVGRHEVIVESPVHNTCLALLDSAAVTQTLVACQARGQAFARDPRIEHIVYFENHGLSAGTSVEHPHAQLLGLPLVPYDVRNRIEEAGRYFDDTGNCVYCDIWQAESAEGTRMIASNELFVAFVPYAALSPFHTWIVPRMHRPSFLSAEPDELVALGQILRDVLHRIYAGLHDPDYNFIIRSAPLQRSERDYLHWYLSIIPRVNETAGFEMGSGMFINTGLPEESALFLRSIDH